jgi:glycosyltransferase involved in cell wall biosynthesis
MSRKIRIGFLASTFTSPKLGGFSRHTLNLIEALSADNPDFEFFLYSNRELAPSHLKRIPKAVPRVLPIKPYFLWEQIGLPIQLSLDRIDIFHSTTNTGVPFFRPFFTSVVQTIHDTFTHQSLARLPRPVGVHSLRAFLGFLASWRAAKSSDAFIAVSGATKAELLKMFPFMESKLKVVLNAADPFFTSGEPNLELLNRFGIRPGYILCVSSGEARKNIDCLLSAYKAFYQRTLSDKIMPPKLVLVGNIVIRESYDGVVQIPYCTEDVLLSLYRGAMFGVAPSLAEGFGFAAVEFAAVGKAAIFSDIPPFRELASKNSPFFSATDSSALSFWMEKLWSDPNECDEWAKKLSAACSRLTWKSSAQSTAEIYRRLCE